jgi:TATA-box binding protein (TBP) (component of TFIID and TFIIIB)
VFQSGCIIITGANCMDHVKVAYKFICDVLSDNVDAVYRRRLMCV